MGIKGFLKILIGVTLFMATATLTAQAEYLDLPPIPNATRSAPTQCLIPDDPRNENIDVNGLIAGIDKKMHRHSKFKGVVLVAHGSTVLFEKGYGKITYAKDQPPVSFDGNTRVLLASMTKQFTAALVLKEIEKNQMNLSDSIRRYIPEGPQSWEPVTIAQLLTHTSGFKTDYIDRPAAVSTNSQDDILAYILKKMKPSKPVVPSRSQRHRRQQTGDDPQYKYNNVNYFLLGIALERINPGKHLEDLVKEEITDPLCMTRSGVISPTSERANGRKYNSDLMPQGNNPASYFAVVNMYSSADDLNKWIWALLEKQIVLSPEMVREMTTAQPHTLYKGSYYGYGFHISSAWGSPLLWHTGHLIDHTTLIRHFMGSHVTLILLTNKNESKSHPWIAPLAQEIMNVVFTYVPRESQEEVITASTVGQNNQGRR